MAHICVSLLVIPAIFIATASTLSPIGDTHCTESAATCPSNSKCDIIAPCMWGVTCSCNTGYEEYTYYNGTGFYRYCVPETALVGEVCDSTVQCSGDNTYCNVGVCTCDDGATVNSAKTECTRSTILLGQNCTRFPNDCGYGAMCQNTICQCVPGYKSFNTTHCTHYEPGEVCPSDECDEFPCAFGTCQSGEFQCTKGMKWYSWDVDANLVDGMCVPMEDWIVGQGHYCEANIINFLATADRLCGHDLECGACPEQPSIKKCLGNGATVVVTSAVMLVTSLVLSLTL